ncbi:MAG: 50S ribosomal protein L21 [Nitrososphaerota archaeon]|nr:50S ribosomal protein L21 [Nitrososphaerota archaeon]
MPKSKGYRRKTRALLTLEKRKGLSYLLQSYNVGDKVIVKLDPTQPKGMPHRRFNGRVGVINEIRKRSLVVDVQVGKKLKQLMVRLEHVKPLRGEEVVAKG